MGVARAPHHAILFRREETEFEAAAFYPHQRDMGFRLRIGSVPEACVKGWFV
jgi:hypothetical protein